MWLSARREARRTHVTAGREEVEAGDVIMRGSVTAHPATGRAEAGREAGWREDRDHYTLTPAVAVAVDS